MLKYAPIMEKVPVTERERIHQPDFVAKTHWLGRLSGLLLISLGGMFLEADMHKPVIDGIFDIAGIAMIISGSGDLITGKHHVLPIAISYLISDYLDDRKNNKS